ncbi:MAG TPA: hypothetical protein VNT60_11000, partial [Deinococcales bacterium]|nr:hypothetical protein [Deinococcales bacterium]
MTRQAQVHDRQQGPLLPHLDPPDESGGNAWVDALTAALARSEDGEQPLSIVVLELDGPAPQWVTPEGLLREAGRVASLERHSAAFALSPGRFLLVLPDANSSLADQVGARLISRLSLDASASPDPVSARYGVAEAVG